MRVLRADKPEDWYRCLTLDIESNNFLQVLGTRGVDYTRTKSNNIWQVYKTLGAIFNRFSLYERIVSACKYESLDDQ